MIPRGRNSPKKVQTSSQSDISSQQESPSGRQKLSQSDRYDPSRRHQDQESARKVIPEYSDQDDNDLSEEDSSDLNQGNRPIEEEEDESEDDSIDYIEERIKKLQRDLEERLGKHKDSVEKQQISKVPLKSNFQKKLEFKNQKISNKNNNQPPLPKKQPQSGDTRTNNLQQLKGSNDPHKSNKNQLLISKPEMENISGVIKKKGFLKQSPIDYPIGRENKDNNIPQEQQKQKRSPISKDSNRDPSINSNNPPEIIQNVPEKTNDKSIQQMQRKIDELVSQNKRLKKQLTRQPHIHQRKKKPNEQLQKLRQISESTTGSAHNLKIQTKLNKEIQLLQVIERLQTKLKASINRNMLKMKTNSTTLLHKGLSNGLHT